MFRSGKRYFSPFLSCQISQPQPKQEIPSRSDVLSIAVANIKVQDRVRCTGYYTVLVTHTASIFYLARSVLELEAPNEERS